MKQPFSGIIITLLLVCGLLTLGAGRARANVAAFTDIINSAQLTFDGGSATATVTVKVNLVPASPNVTITNATGAYTAANTPALTDSVRITSTANGPADYTVAPSIAGDSNATGTSVSGGSTVSIGASVTTGTSGTTFITIPASGASGNDATINGIGVNDTIVFTVNGHTYTNTVTSTVDNGNGTFQVNWSGAIPAADVPQAGVQVGEQKTVNLAVLPGTVITPGTAITVTVQALVTTAGAGNVIKTNDAANNWTTPNPSVLMTKYVRNLTVAGNNPAAGSGTTFTINTTTREYFNSGVTGKPGDSLEYVIVATNSGAVALTNTAIKDNVPVSFVDLSTGVYGGKEVFYIDPSNATFTFTAGGVGANQASYVAANSPNLIVNVGDGATNLLTGNLPAGKSVTVAYQVTIK